MNNLKNKTDREYLNFVKKFENKYFKSKSKSLKSINKSINSLYNYQKNSNFINKVYGKYYNNITIYNNNYKNNNKSATNKSKPKYLLPKNKPKPIKILENNHSIKSIKPKKINNNINNFLNRNKNTKTCKLEKQLYLKIQQENLRKQEIPKSYTITKKSKNLSFKPKKYTINYSKNKVIII